MNKNELKRDFLLLLGFILLMLAFSRLSPYAIEGEVKYVTVTNLNVRIAPDVTSRKIGMLAPNTEITITGVDNGWYQINYDGIPAYVCAKYVAKIVEVSQEPAPKANTITMSPYTDGEDRNYSVALFNRVNEYRTSIGLNQLVWDEALYQTACTRAHEASTNWSHVRPNGLHSWSVLEEYGVSYGTMNENLVADFVSVEDAFEGWMESDGHRRAMSRSEVTKSAVYVYRAPDGTYYAAQHFTN